MKPILVVILAAAIFIIPINKRGIADSKAKTGEVLPRGKAGDGVRTEISPFNTRAAQSTSFLHGEMLFSF